MILAGFVFTLNMYTNLKIGIFAMLIGGGYVLFLFLWDRLWRLPMFWIGMVIFAVTTISFSSPLLAPIILSDELDECYCQDELNDTGFEIVDYIEFRSKYPLNFVQSIAVLDERVGHPKRGTPLVGIVSIVGAGMGLLYAIRVDRRALLWIIMATTFFLLSLGGQWKFNDEIILNTDYTLVHLLRDNPIIILSSSGYTALDLSSCFRTLF